MCPNIWYLYGSLPERCSGLSGPQERAWSNWSTVHAWGNFWEATLRKRIGPTAFLPSWAKMDRHISLGVRYVIFHAEHSYGMHLLLFWCCREALLPHFWALKWPYFIGWHTAFLVNVAFQKGNFKGPFGDEQRSVLNHVPNPWLPQRKCRKYANLADFVPRIAQRA